MTASPSSPLSSTADLAAAWATALASADVPRPWAPPREGGRVPGLRRLPPAARLAPPQLTAALASALDGDAALAALAAASSHTDPVALAALRAAALLAVVGGGDGGQPDPSARARAAALDARAALARAPPGSLAAAVATYLRGCAAEAVHDNSAALLDVATAVSALEAAHGAAPSLPPPPPPSWTDAAARLARRVPGPHADAFTAGGAPALAAALAAAAAAAVPPILRPRPKYYHYFRWMEARLAAVCGGSLPPPPVVDRLLASDAGALDDLLVHGAGAVRAVEALTAALEAGGPAAVEAAPIPRLAWEEMAVVQAARAAVGGSGEGGAAGLLGAGGEAPSVPDGLAWRVDGAGGPGLLPAPEAEEALLALKAFDAMD